MIVHAAASRPQQRRRRKNIQKMTISSGIPRIVWMSVREPHRRIRFRETLNSRGSARR